MHSSSCDLDVPRLGGAEVLVAIAALVTEGRTPNTLASHTNKTRGGFSEGPHCTASKASQGHLCNDENQLCLKYDRIQTYVVSLWQKALPLCIDVLLVPKCCCENDLICNPSASLEPIDSALLLEQWHVTILHRRTHDCPSNFTTNQLINAIRSQLYFSQISAWLAAPDDKIRTSFTEHCIVVYCLTVPGESYGSAKFASPSHQHTFPTADIGNGVTLKVSLANLPRSEELPALACSKCDVPMAVCESNIAVLDDRMQTSCTLKGKHRCDDYDELLENCCTPRYKKRDKNYLNLEPAGDASTPSTSRSLFANVSNQTTPMMQSSPKAKLQLNFAAVPAAGVPENTGDKSKLLLNFGPDLDGADQTRKKASFDKQCDGNIVDLELSKKEFVEVLNVLRHSGPIKQTKKNDLSKGDILLGAILRSSTRVQQLDGHQELVLKMDGGKAKLQENGIGAQPKEKPKSGDFLHCKAVQNGVHGKESSDPSSMLMTDFTVSSKSTTSAEEDVFYKNKKFLDDHTDRLEGSAANCCTERNKRKCTKSGLPMRLGQGQMRIRNCDKNMCDTAAAAAAARNDTILKLLQRTVSNSSGSLNNSNVSRNNSNTGSSSSSSSSGSSSSFSRFNLNDIYTDTHCDNLVKRKKTETNRICDISNVFSLEYLERRQKVKVKQKISFEQPRGEQEADAARDEEGADARKEEAADEVKHSNAGGIPSALEQAKFRKSLDSAASMVFHSRTGLPLTSSPAPVRRGKSCFDFDSSINSVSAIRSALFSLASCSTDEDSESDCSIVSPCSPDAVNGLQQREVPPVKYRHRGQSSGLLGSFVESVLNGRLEPVSTVHGFSAELGASGSFCPRHVVLPVTVFFYTLGDNDKVSTPYLGHINLGKKGYNVPKSGTIQVTLFNPLGTVVKMFVIMYDLSDMPANSQTFIRQRTLFMPANCEGRNLEWSQGWLRYLIHLRFMSSKSGRIYLHSDIRMIICRKSDLDTATAHGIDMSYELRSFTHSPTNPKFSPRK